MERLRITRGYHQGHRITVMARASPVGPLLVYCSGPWVAHESPTGFPVNRPSPPRSSLDAKYILY